ncbi:hypothetical protein HY357_03460 [Candidatus Roizmanbacteria bacterium]|nr:hypothetical protein [Candidatus Roizmanbacteria bacterium]
MDYYKEKQYIAQVDKNDKVIGKIEKWEAHKKGVLHRGYTCVLISQDNYVIQHRKHPVFDGVFDLSFSSHQIFVKNALQDDLTAIYDGLEREWNLKKKDLVSQPKLVKKIYYQAKDPNSEYIEHEIDYIYLVGLKNLPTPNYDFAYGFSLIEKNKLLTTNHQLLTPILAPWVKTMIKEKLIE